MNPIYYEANLDGTTEFGNQFISYTPNNILREIFANLHLPFKTDNSLSILEVTTRINDVDYSLITHISKIHNQEQGRSPSEKRIQVSSAHTTNLYQFIDTNNRKSLILGIYKRDIYSDTIVAAWPSVPSAGTTDSLRIKIQNIANALTDGISVYDNTDNQLIYAFKPEFLPYYIENKESLHRNKISNEEIVRIRSIYLTDEIPEWNDEEYEQLISAYIWMFDRENLSKEYNLSDVIQNLQDSALNNRSLENIERMMRNISYVLNSNNIPFNPNIEPIDGEVENSIINKIIRIHTSVTESSETYTPGPTERSENEERTSKNAAITGQSAENYFEENAEEQFGWVVENKTDTFNLGYDFLCNNPELFFEVKGCREEIQSIRFTKREWLVAEEKGENYILIIVSNLDTSPEINPYSNPYQKYHNTITSKVYRVLSYHLKGRHIRNSEQYIL